MIQTTGIDLKDVDTAPDGLYQILDQCKIGDYYNPMVDTFEKNVPLILMCHIDSGKTELPHGCAAAYFRPSDHARIVFMWTKTQSAPHEFFALTETAK